MFHPCWSFIKFFPQPLQESLSFSAIDIQYADSLLCIQSPIEWSNNEMIFITMTSQDAGRCTEKGVARLLHSPFKIAFTKGKKIRFNKVLDKKRSTSLARVVKVKIGCVTGTSLLWYLKCSVGPTNPILMTFTFYVLNLKIELSHGKRIVIEVSNFFKLSTHVRRSLIETISNEFVHGQP